MAVVSPVTPGSRLVVILITFVARKVETERLQEPEI